MPDKPPYVQCVCPKHGPTTHLHADRERDDWCLLPTTPASSTQREPDTWTCPECGACVPLAWSKCQLCGTSATCREQKP